MVPDSTRLRRSVRLIVLCARTELPAGDRLELRDLVRRGVDWDFLLEKADDEGVLPLLYWNLREIPDAVPPGVIKRLKAHYLRNLARSVQIRRQVEPFLKEVRRAGLHLALTKGLRLASTVYPDFGLRPFWDVDFAASAEDWPAVAELLRSHGFEETPAPNSRRPGLEDERDWTYSPYFKRGDVFLEFHFNPLGLHFPVGGAQGEGWAGGTFELGQAEVGIFSPERELCYLCLHAQQHSYRRLIWLTDIREMAARGGLDWDRVIRISQAFRIQASVYHALVLVEGLWPETVPREALAAVRPSFMSRAALGFFWPAAKVAARAGSPAWPYYMPSLFSLWERRSPALAARTLRAILFPPRPWLAKASGIPSASFRLYYQYLRRISRPVGLAVRRLVDIR